MRTVRALILAALFVLRGDKTRRVVRFRLHCWEHYLVRLPKELGEFLVGDTLRHAP